MTRSFLAFVAALAVVVALLELTPVPLEGQAPAGTATEAAAGPAPKTAWGEPDLQGVWTNGFDVPLQRPAQYANREFFTEAERAAFDKQIAGILGRDASDTRRKRGTEQDVGGAYNAAVFTTHKHTGRATSLIVDPPDGRIPPLTPEAAARNKAMREFQLALIQATDTCKNKLPSCTGGKYGPPSPRRTERAPRYSTIGLNRAENPEDRSLGERCLSAGLPDFGGFTGFYPRIVQTPGAVSMYYDTGQGQGWHRVIPVTSAPHLPSHIRQWWGDSRGRWEGNTLVVDVTNFSSKRDYQGSRENLHLVERWTRIDANTLEYVVKVEDPTTWTRPWTVRQEWAKQSDQANQSYSEPRCHEGNYGLVGLLVGGRATDRAFAQGKGPDPATVCIGGCGGFAGGFADDGEDSNPLR